MEEKFYTVSQIATILNTNPETVRRWIRNGDLKATQASKKQGNVITEDSFQDFLKQSPKYMPLALTATVSGALGSLLGAAAAGLVIGTITALTELKKDVDYIITDSELQEYLDKAISEKDDEIQKNWKLIAELELKNQMLESEISTLREVKKQSSLVAQTITDALIPGSAD